MVDTEHGNIIYYELMSRYKNNKGTRLVAGADYSVGKDRSWNAALGVKMDSESLVHYSDGDPYEQKWTLLAVTVGGWKSLNIGTGILDISVGAAYILPLGEAVYATGNTASAKDDISGRYVAPTFAYETSGKLSASIRTDWVFSSIKPMAPGLFIKGSLLKQMGPAPQYPALEGTSFYGLSAGVFLKF